MEILSESSARAKRAMDYSQVDIDGSKKMNRRDDGVE
jgi:hypothetical protein